MSKSVIAQEFEAIRIALEALEPLSGTQREFALKMISARLGLSVSPPATDTPTRSIDGAHHAAPISSVLGSDGISARDFLRNKKPATDLERYVCLAYFLSKHQNSPSFSTREITKLNSEAGGQNFSNARATAGNAVRQSKMLGNAPNGKKRLTLRGEELVDALPDRDKVNDVIKSKPRKRKARTKTKNK